ncbi:sigma-54 interaction domain-containing protein [Myxococcota bacterium]
MGSESNLTQMDNGSRDAILDSIADGVFTEEITGIKGENAVGRYCFEVFKASICEGGCVLRKTLETGKPSVHQAAYIIKKDGKRIPISISTAELRDSTGQVVGGVETFRDLSVVEALRKELKKRFSFGDIVAKNKKIHGILKILPQVALSDATVLIQGESGTGKELFARAIHSQSHRKEGPLINLNCAALPDTLLESELFGHVAGAFTDARRNRPGRFADGGTIFLDEIGDISPALQVRLLRVIQEKTFEPLGGTETKKVNVRVVAASNRNLSEMVEAGQFREDLFYRLNVVSLKIPPLRERRDDIPLLVEYFIDHFNQLKGKEISHMERQAMGILMKHLFPGNVRELINIVEHAFVLCPGGALLVEHLPEYLQPEDPLESKGPIRTFRHAEADLIQDVLSRHKFNRAKAAEELGIHKTTLWRKMKKLGISSEGH